MLEFHGQLRGFRILVFMSHLPTQKEEVQDEMEMGYDYQKAQQENHATHPQTSLTSTPQAQFP